MPKCVSAKLKIHSKSCKSCFVVQEITVEKVANIIDDAKHNSSPELDISPKFINSFKRELGFHY